MTLYQPALPTPPLVPAEAPAIDAHFDEVLADQLAHGEAYNRHHYRPNSYLHKWWARRCGSTFRLILKALVEPEWQRSYYEPGGLAGQVILDPMLGGGTTLHEAIRLGACVVGADIDPIPILQARATLTDLSLEEELEPAFDHFYTALKQTLAPLFRTTCPTCGEVADLRFVLHGVRRCGPTGPVLCLDSLILRSTPDGSVLSLCPDTQALLQDGAPLAQPTLPTLPLATGVRRATRLRDDLERPYYDRMTPVAVAGQCAQHGAFFKLPDAGDMSLLKMADGQRPVWGDSAEFRIQPGPKSGQLARLGVLRYDELFSSRQLLFLEAVGRQLALFPTPIRLNLALLASTALEFNSLLCGYKGANRRRPGAIRHTFAYHAYTFPNTVVENNPLFPGHKSSGTLTNLFHRRIRRARRWAALPQERDALRRRWRPIQGEVDLGTELDSPADLGAAPARSFLLQHRSAVHLDLPDASVDHIVTDPPYYDSVQYGDLAAFFRVWLARWLPEALDWRYDLTHAAVEHNANGQYETALSAIFQECRRVLRPTAGRLIFTFHHGQAAAWAALTMALRRAGFRLMNRYVVFAENPSSVHIANLTALTHDAILVLAAPGSRQTPPDWSAPTLVRQTDCAAFMRACGELLGWLLAAPLSETEIRACWQEHLG